MACNEAEAEDLAQEVFLRVFRTRDRYEPRARFSTWLYRIASNVSLNSLRSRSRRHTVILAGGHQAASARMLFQHMVERGAPAGVEFDPRGRQQPVDGLLGKVLRPYPAVPRPLVQRSVLPVIDRRERKFVQPGSHRAVAQSN